MVNVVTFGMFSWAVRCGIRSEADFWEGAPTFRGILFQAVGLCHCPRLVNVDMAAFIRCSVCVGCGILFDGVVVCDNCWCAWVLTEHRLCSCARG